jgi:cytochrome c-type biogenesis protein CcmH
MTGFLIGSALLIGVAIAFLLWPLLRGGAGAGNREKAIVALYRDKFRELASEQGAGSISAEQFESGRRELERRLLEEVTQPATMAPSAGAPARRSASTAVAVTAFVLLVPMGLYLALGRPEAIHPVPSESEAAGSGQASAQGKAAPHELTTQQLQAMIDQLAKHLAQSPKDGQGWAMLARTYAYTKQFPEAVKAYARASELMPTDSHLLADYADALAMTNERRLSGEPMKLIGVAGAKAIGPLAVGWLDAWLGSGAGPGRLAVLSVIASSYHSTDTPWGYPSGRHPGPPTGP